MGRFCSSAAAAAAAAGEEGCRTGVVEFLEPFFGGGAAQVLIGRLHLLLSLLFFVIASSETGVIIILFFSVSGGTAIGYKNEGTSPPVLYRIVAWYCTYHRMVYYVPSYRIASYHVVISRRMACCRVRSPTPSFSVLFFYQAYMLFYERCDKAISAKTGTETEPETDSVGASSGTSSGSGFTSDATPGTSGEEAPSHLR